MSKEEMEYLTLEYDEKYKDEPWYLGTEVEVDDHGPHLAMRVVGVLPRPKLSPPNDTIKLCVYLCDA